MRPTVWGHPLRRDAVEAGSYPKLPPRWPTVFTACSGLLGGAGVMIAAAGAHAGGGDLSRTAADFLMIHAAVVLAGSVLAAFRQGADLVLGLALGLLTAGSLLFSGELTLASLADWHPLPAAAPMGGACLILGWLLLTVFAVRACLERWP